MRIKSVRISGFKPIPFAADYVEPAEGRRNGQHEIRWHEGAFQVAFAVEPPLLNAIIGPNSSGKSSILYALNSFFSRKTKLPQTWYNGKITERPVIIEITFVGHPSVHEEWCQENCVTDEHDVYELTVAYVWRWDVSRVDLLRNSTTHYRKVNTSDRRILADLFPNYRLLPAYSKLSDDANFEKSDLLADLMRFILEGKAITRRRSIVYKLQRAIAQLKQLAKREAAPNSTAWREIEELERVLSNGINSITPGNPRVRIQFESSIPDLTDLFSRGRIFIDDGIELDSFEHGMGLQRSLVVSILHAWHEIIARQRRGKDYIFAIEEPELYLHPHATRVFIETLKSVSRSDQVLFTTHSSEFVNQVPLKNVISIRRVGHQRKVVVPNLSSLNSREKTKVRRYLQEYRSDMLFARAVLLVEGASELYAIPAFARKLGFDLDRAGVSVVFVNGKQNFEVYHQILKAFGIPHVILGDGDGNPEDVRNTFNQWDVSGVYVLEFDLEYEVAGVIGSGKFLEIYNESRARLGKDPQTLENLSIEITSDNLRRIWWEAIKEKLNATIYRDYRSEYEEERQQIREVLGMIAERVIENEHLLPNAQRWRRAELLKKLGKPLVGRVVGELLSTQEVKRMREIVSAIQTVVDVANPNN